MLDKETLKNSIETAIKTAMTNALLETFKFKDTVTPESMAKLFGEAAGKCADTIATAIEVYIKDASLLIPVGTTIPAAPGLISPSGPVVGSLVSLGPVIIDNVIK